MRYKYVCQKWCSVVDKMSARTTNKSYVYILNSNVRRFDESIWEHFYGGYMYTGKHINSEESAK